MDLGMLWYDDDKRRPLAEKIRQAAEYYLKKYGQVITQCYVHPRMLPEGQALRVAGIRVLPSRVVVMNHMWLGIGKA